MNKNDPPMPYMPPPYAPPSYSQAVGGVPPVSPYTPAETYTSAPLVTTIVPLGPGSTHTICPHCYAEIDTTTMTKPGLIAYISGILIAVMGCWQGCCLIPCCIDECMDVHHRCPNCKTYLGCFRR